MYSKTILYFVLNWGLGHATRSIPVIQVLQRSGHHVVLVSTGRSLQLLRQEFPDSDSIDLPDYSIRYSRFGWALIPHLLMQMPRIFCALVQEHRATEKLVKKFKADLIVSDNRYGCYSRHIPTFFMTHQLRFQLPKCIRWSAFISEWFNRFYFRHYYKVLVPDFEGPFNLSGDLSHCGSLAKHNKVCYVGPLSSLTIQEDAEQDIDLLVLISGPEPQRTQFQARIVRQIQNIPGKRVIILGKPEGVAEISFLDDLNLEIFPHFNRHQMSKYVQRAKVILARSGYSTLMELVPQNKKLILIPTPGQTEQEYLARHLMTCYPSLVSKQKTFNIRSLLLKMQSIEGSQLTGVSNQLDRILVLLSE